MNTLQISTTLNIGSSVDKRIPVYIHKDDSNLWRVRVTIKLDGHVYDIPDDIVELFIEKPDGVYYVLNGTTESTGIYLFTLDGSVTDTNGDLICQVYCSKKDRSQSIHSALFTIPIVE